MQIFFVLLLVGGGVGLTLQAAVNGRLREAVGSPVLSALISFGVGIAALLLVLLTGALGRGRLTGLAAQPWWIWGGGLFGAFYVAAAAALVQRVGSGVLIACTVFGQLLAALVLDSQGWLGVPRAPLSLWRVAGAVLLLAGVLLLQKK